MERLTDGTIVAAPSDNICELASSLRSGETLALSPGVYKTERCIVVDKDVTIKSATENARDVTIVRAGSTVLAVKSGSPTIERLTFISTLAQGDGGPDLNDEYGYQSCVTVRGGSPTLIGCRATSAEQSGFSVRGKGTTARLVRCEARQTHDGGVFFDDGASGVVEDCVFADNGLGCVDVEQTPPGKWVEIVRTKLYRSGFASLAIHNKGRARITNCDLNSHRPFGFDAHVMDGVLEARSCRFRNDAPISEDMSFDAERGLGLNDVPESFIFAIGIRAGNSKITVEDSTFEQLVSAFVSVGFPSKLTMTRCKVVEGLESVFLDPDSPAPTFEDCEFFKAPIEFREKCEAPQVGSDEPDADEEGDDDEDKNRDRGPRLNEEELKATLERNMDAMEEILGPLAPTYVEPDENWLCGLLYPSSRYGGTFVATNQLFCTTNPSPSNSKFRMFELAMATSMVNLEECGIESASDPWEHSTFNKLFEGGASAEVFRDKILDMLFVLTVIAGYIADGNTIEQYETLEFPENCDLRALAGRCFVFDALSMKSDPASEVDPAELFDYDLDTIPKLLNVSAQEDFGLLLVVEITPEELKLVRKEGGGNFIPHFQEAKHWPFSDLDREQCLDH